MMTFVMKPIFTDTSKWKLSDAQNRFVKSICPLNICATYHKIMDDYVNALISNNSVKNYKLLLVYDQFLYNYFPPKIQIPWLKCILECSILSLDNRRNIKSINLDSINNSGIKINIGALRAVTEAIQNSNMRSPPRVIPTGNLSTSSSVFQNSSPDVIINISKPKYKMIFIFN